MPIMCWGKDLIEIFLKGVLVKIYVALKVGFNGSKLSEDVQWRVEIGRRRVLEVCGVYERSDFPSTCVQSTKNR